MILAAISEKGKSELFFVEVNQNAQSSTTLLTNYILSFFETHLCNEDKKAIFQKVNAPASSAFYSKKFFGNILGILD